MTTSGPDATAAGNDGADISVLVKTIGNLSILFVLEIGSAIGSVFEEMCMSTSAFRNVSPERQSQIVARLVSFFIVLLVGKLINVLVLPVVILGISLVITVKIVRLMNALHGNRFMGPFHFIALYVSFLAGTAQIFLSLYLLLGVLTIIIFLCAFFGAGMILHGIESNIYIYLGLPPPRFEVPPIL